MKRRSIARRPFGSTLVLAVVLMLAGGALIEIGLRLATARWNLPVGIVGSGNPSFDVTVDRIERFTKRHGAPRVVCVGSSMIKKAVDPAVFETRIGGPAGERPFCFNFGVAGFTAEGAVRIVDLVQQHFGPELILFDASPVVFQQIVDPHLASTAVPRSTWFRHQMGEPSVDGFLIDRLMLVRYFLRARLYLEEPANHQQIRRYDRRTRFDGFDTNDTARGRAGVRVKVRTSLRRADPVPQQLALLDDLLPAHHNLVLIETPVSPRFTEYYPQGQVGYERALDAIDDIARKWGSPFVRSSGSFRVPDSHWVNDNHLSSAGAAVFARWLAGELDGTTLDPPQPADVRR
jgi:hypothetical protein